MTTLPPIEKGILISEIMEVTVFDIQTGIASSMGINRDDILGKSRKGNIVLARHMAIYVSEKATGANVAQLGLLFNRCPNLISYALSAFQERMDVDKTAEAFAAQWIILFTNKPITAGQRKS